MFKVGGVNKGQENILIFSDFKKKYYYNNFYNSNYIKKYL